MDKSNAKLSSFHRSNGFTFRSKYNKTKLKWMNSFPFTLAATSENLSQNLYGLSKPLTDVSYDLPFNELKNTEYVSFDYESYCDTSSTNPLKLIKSKKSNAQQESKKSKAALSRNSRALKRSLKHCDVSLERLSLTDLLKFKLSNGSKAYVESLISKQDANSIADRMPKIMPKAKPIVEEIIILSDSSDDENDSLVESSYELESNSRPNAIEILNSTIRDVLSSPMATDEIQTNNSEPIESEPKEVNIPRHTARTTSTQKHDSLINDFELRAEIEENLNETILNKEVLSSISNLKSFDSSNNFETMPNEHRKVKRSLSKQQLLSNDNSNKRYRSVDGVHQRHFGDSSKFSIQNVTKQTNYLTQPYSEKLTLSVTNSLQTSTITYNEFVSRNKKIQYEQRLFGKTSRPGGEKKSNIKANDSNDIEIIDLTI